ncbi:putative lipoyltransferase 2, mitochondrial [Toxorhynchites rutilus septentrionalis]|uniref:putative lipoyltransferase 2, mitochondrial n=1 Tax=Toxorhynchites rutilus septentrionalis TaxID=329112 RepID=UPI002479F5AC|nr:putative lipoyltransferase 2, mitochondrial [Toxorhynchites rutilus septentrionalis]
MPRVVHVLRAGRLGYQSSLNLQQIASNSVLNRSDGPVRNILILTEHDPVYTVGIRTKAYGAEEEQRLRALGAEFYRTNRGGLITFHGPGQLVAYPVLNLRNFQPSVRWYVCQIESTIIDLCSKMGIRANRTHDTGIWVQDRKICAIGIHASRYVTTHGLALNCNTDLRWFEHIVPCGIEGKGVTSLSGELKREVDVEDVIPQFLGSFRETLECDLVEMDEAERGEVLKRIGQ